MGKDDDPPASSPDYGDKLVAPPDFDGPTSHRRCTDILCLPLLFCMWAAMTGLGVYSMSEGDYRVLLSPMDYDGNVCGTDYGSVDMTDFPFLYYVNDFGGGVCVQECPVLPNGTHADAHTLVTYDGIYQTSQATLPPDFINVGNYSTAENKKTCTELLCYPGEDPELSYKTWGVNQGKGYAYYAMDTYEVLWRCLYTDTAKDTLEDIILPDGYGNLTIVDVTNSTVIATGYNVYTHVFGDLWVARYWILGMGFGAPLIIGFMYTFLLRIPGVLVIMVWGSILVSISVFFLAGAYALKIAGEWGEAEPQIYSDDQITAAQIGSYVLFAIGGLLVILFLFMRKRIHLAMGCVKEASRAVARMPLLVLFPVVQGLGLLVFMVAWTVYAVNLASLGDLQVQEFNAGVTSVSVRYFEFSDFVFKCGWYMLFCFFWTSQFIIALGEIIFALSIAKWYFSREKANIGTCTVVESIGITLWYHSGTAAFGSLLIAIIKMIRAFLAYLQKKAEEMDSSIAKAVICCFQCCFYCLEKCMKFLNKNAYIQTAIFSTSFCTSAKEAFFLILRNAARIAAITYVSGGVVFVGKLFIMSFSTGLAYYGMDQNIHEHVYSLYGPVIIIAFISYFIAGMFMSVYDMAIATMLQCFVADEEMFEGDQVYAEGALKSWIDKHG